jgi:hypothetical protein
MFLLYKIVQDGPLGPSGASQKVRFTHRLSLKKVEERKAAVNKKIIQFVMEKGGFFGEDALNEQLQHEFADHQVVKFRRGRIRLAGLDTIMVPIMKVFDFSRELWLFNCFWAIKNKMKIAKIQLRVARKLFGANITEGARPRPTRFWYKWTAAFVSFGRPYWKLSNSRKVFVDNFLSHREGLLKFWRSRSIPIAIILRQFWRESVSLKKTTLEGLDLNVFTDEQMLKRTDFIKPQVVGLFGVRPLTRVQIARLFNNKVKHFKYMLWDLLMDLKLIRFKVFLSSTVYLCLEMSLYSVMLYTVRKHPGKGWIRYSYQDLEAPVSTEGVWNQTFMKKLRKFVTTVEVTGGSIYPLLENKFNMIRGKRVLKRTFSFKV